jgi:HemK-related putative methylase
MQEIYEPREDSYFLETQIGRYARGNVLDMGTGSGILAFAAAKTAKTVLAVDINSHAIELLKKVCEQKKIQTINTRKSNLFSQVKEKFDCIIFNPPYLPNEPLASDIALDGGPEGYELILRFLSQAKHHLTETGVVILLFSSFSKKKIIDHALLSQGYSFEEIATKNLDFEILYIYAIRRKDLLAKGKRGLISLSTWKGKTICVKEANPQSHVGDRIAIESQFLKKVNELGIGPTFYYFKEGRLGMEFIEGERILEFLESEKTSRSQAIFVVKDVLRQCFVLDCAGITKEEMTNPYKHILVKKQGVQRIPVFIDFERSKHQRHPSNLTQVLQFITSNKVKSLLEKKGIIISRLDYNENIVKQYKEKPAIGFYLEIMRKLGIATFSEKCYARLSCVKKGQVTTYNEIAKALNTRAYQAVGNAMNKNPYAPHIPCHRVVNADGRIGGFQGGVKKKITMLDLEGVHVKNGRIIDFEKHLFRYS